MIEREDKVSAVLARDAGLVEVFVAVSPAFQRLRNPALRRVMARLVTVEQAARVAGVDAQHLVDALNRALAAAGADAAPPPADAPLPPPVGTASGGVARDADASSSTAPPAVPPDRIIDLDVREDLRNGREPFSRIMAARRSMRADGALRVRALFEPAPLYDVMARQGLAHFTEKLADDDWRVWFFAAGEQHVDAGVTAPGVASPHPSGGGSVHGDDPTPEESVHVIDVRGLEPPEPMVRTLAALERLPAGATLVQINVRVPRFLLPELAARGFEWEIREQGPELVRLFIRRGESRDGIPSQEE
jgi:uncharacterized protein (DUF2249 family)